MMTVGITGGIGSGKSTVVHLYEQMGYPVYDADSRAKWLMNNSTLIKDQLITSFGEKVYPKQLDRKILADVVFLNPEALQQLNSIIHPEVEKDWEKWSHSQNAHIIFKEAAILFESGSNTDLDQVICISAPEITRIMRVMKRDGVTAEQVQERISNQWSDEKKISLADYLIIADETQLVIPQALNILEKLKWGQ
jgi:dephospho-CoA kinase